MSSRKRGRKQQKRKQNTKARYAKAREDAQLEGVIETTPDGAVRNEVVPPIPDPPIPALDRQAIRNGWEVPEPEKPRLVDRLISHVLSGNCKPLEDAANVKVLLMVDQKQWERDHPVAAGKARGGTEVTVQTIDLEALFLEADRRRKIGLQESGAERLLPSKQENADNKQDEKM